MTSSCPYFWSTCYIVSDELPKSEKEWHVSVTGIWQLVNNTTPRGRPLYDKLTASQQKYPCLAQRSFTLKHHIRSNATSDGNLRQHYTITTQANKPRTLFEVSSTKELLYTSLADQATQRARRSIKKEVAKHVKTVCVVWCSRAFLLPRPRTQNRAYEHPFHTAWHMVLTHTGQHRNITCIEITIDGSPSYVVTCVYTTYKM